MIVSFSHSFRTVGGTETLSREFPWIVNIRTLDASGQVVFNCGGTLIDQNTVLTAAHCLHKQVPENVVIVAGDYNISCTGGPEQIAFAKEIRIHENFNRKSKVHDIALIRLDKDVTVTDAVNFTSISDFDPIENAETGVVAGWGAYGNKNKNFSDILLKAEIPILDAAPCNIPEEHRLLKICAGGNGSDTCKGDSGGPLMCRRNNQLYVCRVVSGGEDESCGGHKPGVYMNAYGYKEWIEKNRHFPPIPKPTKLPDWMIVIIVGGVALAVVAIAFTFNRAFKRRGYNPVSPSGSIPNVPEGNDDTS